MSKKSRAKQTASNQHKEKESPKAEHNHEHEHEHKKEQEHTTPITKPVENKKKTLAENVDDYFNNITCEDDNTRGENNTRGDNTFINIYLENARGKYVKDSNSMIDLFNQLSTILKTSNKYKVSIPEINTFFADKRIEKLLETAKFRDVNIALKNFKSVYCFYPVIDKNNINDVKMYLQDLVSELNNIR
jgi:hypothetical protein